MSIIRQNEYAHTELEKSEKIQTGEILSDKAGEHERPWREKHLAGQKVAAAYSALGKPGKAARCRDCGTMLVFNECVVDGQKRLKNANFCRERLCPMCMWRRSLKWAAEASMVFHQAAEQYKTSGFLLLTLTQKNVVSSDLSSEITRILQGWERLRKRKEFQVIQGWLRTLEITRNTTNGTWHPHIHAVLMIPASYWSKHYVTHQQWISIWREVLGLNYDPSVDIHRVKVRNGDKLSEAAAEVGKYTVKDSDLISDGNDVIARVQTLDAALKGRRLIAWGGVLKQLAKKVETPEDEENLVLITGENHGPTCPVCGGELIEHTYRWIASIKNYMG